MNDVAFVLFWILVVVGIIVGVSFYYWIEDIEKVVKELKERG